MLTQPSRVTRSAQATVIVSVGLFMVALVAIGLLAWSAGVDRMDRVADPAWFGGAPSVSPLLWR